ncbi:MAG: saccharopine dehydrogenase NADP-binding domain-containing protein [Planctomycetota bacterium]|nr:saccharopine dehydrogenase NADP-binding domain-containing protein [Planctomycetota bacterium]
MTNISFNGKVLIIGFGGVAQCTLPLLRKHMDTPVHHFTVMDFADEVPEKLQHWIDAGVNFCKDRIQPARMAKQLGALVGPGDMIIDLAWNIDCVDILTWCYKNQVLYINTSVELWDPYADNALTPPERTLYVRHMAIRKMLEDWGGNRGPTAVLDHGANPGLVSHFTKRALRDIAAKIVTDRPDDPRRATLERALADRHYNLLAQTVGVKTIHVSERDTQVSYIPRQPGEFVNTWSVEGLYEEGVAPAEMGWGTHERTLPVGAWEHKVGPCNQICLDSRGIDTFVRTRVPSSDIVGMVIRHGEAFSLSDYLSVADTSDKIVYRPTVHYTYLPCADASACLRDVRANNYRNLPRHRIMSDDIGRGLDELGVLLMGHDYKSWWCGTILSIQEARELVPHQNATTLQVAASILGAVAWMIRNPKRGVRLPDELPDDEILNSAGEYLGHTPSIPLDWTPLGVLFRSRPGECDEDGQPIVGPRLLKEHLDPLTLS